MELLKYLLLGGAAWFTVDYLTQKPDPEDQAETMGLIPQFRLADLELRSPLPNHWVVVDTASGDEIASGEVVDEGGLIMGTLYTGPAAQAGPLNLDVEGENAHAFFADVKGKLVGWQRAV
jgi:hypothetical protein